MSFFIFISSLACTGQTERYSLLTFTCSNNGQINNIIDDFYFSEYHGQSIRQISNYTQSDFKYNLHYEYVNVNNFVFYCMVGYSEKKESFTISNIPPVNESGNKKQNYFNVAVGAKYIYSVGKFQLSSGIEIPYYKISRYEEKYFFDSPTQTTYTTNLIDGGNAYGLNNISSIKIFFFKRFFFSTDLTFGLLALKLGGQNYSIIDYDNPAISTTNPPYEQLYKKTAITNPELYFGVGIKI